MLLTECIDSVRQAIVQNGTTLDLYFQTMIPWVDVLSGCQTHDGETLSPNMALWNMEHFKPKEFEKKAEAGRFLWPSLPTPSLSLKQVIKPTCDKCPPYTRGRELPYLGRQSDAEKNLNKQACSAGLLHLPQRPWLFIFLHDCPLHHT